MEASSLSCLGKPQWEQNWDLIFLFSPGVIYILCQQEHDSGLFYKQASCIKLPLKNPFDPLTSVLFIKLVQTQNGLQAWVQIQE